jgi:F420-non-reducing hydrogenase small subunit
VIPTDGVPPLLKHARPLREFVPVDLSLPGCPPPAKTIAAVISDLVDGKKREPALAVMFG